MIQSSLGALALAALAASGASAPAALDERFPPASPESVGLSGAALEQLVGVVQRFVDREEIVGGELVVIKHDKTVLHTGFGWRDRERKVPFTPDSVYCVRSMTKPLVGVAVQMLADEGRLALADPVSKHLPELDNDRCRAITIDQLLTHTGGLTLSSLIGVPLSGLTGVREVARRTGERGPEFPPGTRFHYSDDGADTLGALVEAVSGRPLEEFVRERILEPLGMQDSRCVLRADDPQIARVGSAYAGASGAWLKFWEPGKAPIFPVFLASQGLYSTPHDYARFLTLFSPAGDAGEAGQARLLTREAVQRALQPVQRMGYPTGFRGAEVWYGRMMTVYRDQAGALLAFGHNGSDGTHSYVFPEHDLTVLYFTQSRGSLTFTKFEAALDAWLLGRQDPAARHSPAAGGAEQTGLYFLERAQLLCGVLHYRDELTIDFPWESAYALAPAGGEDRWSFALRPEAIVEFTRGEDGGIGGLQVTTRGVLEMTRVVPDPDLPDVDELMELRADSFSADLLAATGPIRLSGTIRRGDLKGSISQTLDGTSRYRSDVDLGGDLERTVVDGDAVWSRSQDLPAVELAGLLAEQKRLATADALHGDWRGRFRRIVVARRVEHAGREALLVHCTPERGLPYTQTIDAETGHLLRQQHVLAVPGVGACGATTEFGDYRDAGSVQLPFHLETRYASPLLGAHTIQLETAEIDVELDDAWFRLSPGKD